MIRPLTLREQLAAAVARSVHWRDLAMELMEHRDVSKDEWTERAYKAESFIREIGYRRCDIAACNCGSWHKWEL
jgi:hypothetical protein